MDVRLIAKKVLRYAGRRIAQGQQFVAHGSTHARLLKATGRAVDAPSETKPAPKPPPKPKPAAERKPMANPSPKPAPKPAPKPEPLPTEPRRERPERGPQPEQPIVEPEPSPLPVEPDVPPHSTPLPADDKG
jgi:hypothetical protein